MKYTNHILAAGVLLAQRMPSVTAASVPINTPSPMLQPSYPACEQFHMAVPGEDCNSIIAAVGLNRYEFFRINPAVGGEPGCKDMVKANTWYCVKSKGGAVEPAASATAPANTHHVVKSSRSSSKHPDTTEKSKPTKTKSDTGEMRITTIALPDQDSCRYGDCWYAFGTMSSKGNEQKLSSATSLCSRLFHHGCRGEFDWPGHIGKLCDGGCEELSSACPCFLAGRYHTRTGNGLLYSRPWDGKDWHWPGDED